MSTHYIHNLEENNLPASIGSKARSLRLLLEKNVTIPDTHVCTWEAYTHYLNDRQATLEILKKELSTKIDETQSYAVRSSANIEDGKNHSFAGQFKSSLNIQGTHNILHAIETIWSSALSQNVHTYLKKTGKRQDDLKMAVIIQKMVPPVLSGVSFSRNPMTGMDEIIVEAVEGSGESLLQDGITPLRWTNKWGTWIDTPDNGNIDLTIIQEIVTKTRKIAKAHGEDIDLEWVYDGTTINWVQLREITSLQHTHLYSNNFAREVFPGMIKPLIWSTNVPLVCGAWVRFFTELIGTNDIHPRSLAKSFYYRAYFNMGTIGKIFEALGFPRNTLELLMNVEAEGSEKPSFKPTKRTLMLIPRLVRFAIGKLTFSRKIKPFFADIRPHYKSFSTEYIHHLSEKDIISEIDRLYLLNEKTAYFTIVIYLLMGLYTNLLKQQLKKLDVDFENFDLTMGMDELKQFDPNPDIIIMNQLFNQLDESVKDQIRKCSFKEFANQKEAGALKKKLIEFIDHFGHLSNSGNDFSSIPWREDPEVVLKMIINYSHSKNKPTSKLHFEKLNISLSRRLLLKPLFKRARSFRLYREEISSLYTFGYGLFRNYFLALGNHFSRRGVMKSREDIFYLYFDEIKSIVQGPLDRNYTEVISKRKSEISEYQDITLPKIIYGDQPPPVRREEGKKLKGIPTSKGYYKGPVKVIQSLQDSHKLLEGDILVIPYSDVGWTPLFTRAGAIIAESGGFLSHSSIIAREYGIPAIVSVSGACRIKDGTVVTVDCYQGEIVIQANSET